MQYTINGFRMEAFKEVYQVYKVFQDFFGEDSVDLQGLPDDDMIAFRFDEHDIPMQEDGSCYEANGNKFNSVIRDFSNTRPFILVYWPRVKVTNENDKSIIIQDLYAKIELDAKGYIPTEDKGFTLNRATYPMEQWVCSYMHSHISSIPKEHPDQFQSPCLGTGPIIQTINSLRANISEGFDETRWMLFCHELSLYVTVESLAGVPYNRLENVHLNNFLSSYYGKYDENYGSALDYFSRVFPLVELKEFILYYLHNGHLAINYQNGAFKVGMSYFDYIIDISNSFIEYFNTYFNYKSIAQKCFDYYVLYHSIASNGHFFDPDTSYTIPDVSAYVGEKVCTFKGRDITLRIMDSKEESQKTTVLNHGLAMYILNNILKIINYRYTNEYTRQHCQGTTALPAPIGQRVYYI